MLRENATTLRSLLAFVDVATCALLYLALLYALRLDPFGSPPSAAARLGLLGAASCVAWPLLLARSGLYTSQRRISFGHILSSLLLAAVTCSVVLLAIAFLLTVPAPPSLPILCAGLQLVGLASIRIVGVSALRFVRRRGRNYRNVLIVGSGPRARDISQLIQAHHEWGLRILGFVDDRDVPVDPSIPSGSTHKFSDVPRLLRDEVVDELIVAYPLSLLPELLPLVRTCASAGVPVNVLSDIFGDDLPSPAVTAFDTRPALRFAPVHHDRVALVAKRAIDVLGASIGLMLAAPLLGVAALWIRATSPGPVLFRQLRCGLNGRHFELLKLRTMYEDAPVQRAQLEHLNESDGPAFKLRNDPRVTPVGAILRRWSIDELPQLWNVLKGHMSLVGPRPPVPEEVAQYDTLHLRRLSMRPGLTCRWQVSGRSAIGFADWIRLDVEYIDNWSLLEDLRLLVRTVPAVLKRDGAW